MHHDEFRIGLEFWCAGKRWRCTGIGSRVIVAVCLEQAEGAAESIFHEYDLPACSLTRQEL